MASSAPLEYLSERLMAPRGRPRNRYRRLKPSQLNPAHELSRATLQVLCTKLAKTSELPQHVP